MPNDQPKSQLARDFAVFMQPGFLLSLLLLFGLCAMVAAAAIWGNVMYGISPF